MTSEFWKENPRLLSSPCKTLIDKHCLLSIFLFRSEREMMTCRWLTWRSLCRPPDTLTPTASRWPLHPPSSDPGIPRLVPVKICRANWHPPAPRRVCVTVSSRSARPTTTLDSGQSHSVLVSLIAVPIHQ